MDRAATTCNANVISPFDACHTSCIDGFAAYASKKLGVPVKILTATEFIGINNALDPRDDYYATLERSLARACGPTARISTIGHFQGRAAAAPADR